MERERDMRESKRVRGGLGLACGQACSVRAIENKVIQGLVSCLMGCSGGGVGRSFWSSCVSCSCVSIRCPLLITHQNAVLYVCVSLFICPVLMALSCSPPQYISFFHSTAFVTDCNLKYYY